MKIDQMVWKPINTAPHYNHLKREYILVWDKFRNKVEMTLADGDFWSSRGDECMYTHWMPLPDGPTKENAYEN